MLFTPSNFCLVVDLITTVGLVFTLEVVSCRDHYPDFLLLRQHVLAADSVCLALSICIDLYQGICRPEGIVCFLPLSTLVLLTPLLQAASTYSGR